MTFCTACFGPGCLRACSGSRISKGSGPRELWASTMACACGCSRPEASVASSFFLPDRAALAWSSGLASAPATFSASPSSGASGCGAVGALRLAARNSLPSAAMRSAPTFWRNCGSSSPSSSWTWWRVSAISVVSACSNSSSPGSVLAEHDQQLLELLVLGLGVLLLVAHAQLVPERVEHRLLGERVQRELEADLVDQDAAVPAAGLEVLELALDDGVVVGDEVVDVAGQGLVGQGHFVSSGSVGGLRPYPPNAE